MHRVELGWAGLRPQEKGLRDARDKLLKGGSLGTWQGRLGSVPDPVKPRLERPDMNVRSKGQGSQSCTVSKQPL